MQEQDRLREEQRDRRSDHLGARRRISAQQLSKLGPVASSSNTGVGRHDDTGNRSGSADTGVAGERGSWRHDESDRELEPFLRGSVVQSSALDGIDIHLNPCRSERSYLDVIPRDRASEQYNLLLAPFGLKPGRY